MENEEKPRNRISKDMVPEGFTWQLALVDLLPCLFFGLTGFFLGLLLNSIPVEIAALVIFFSGVVKVIWKMIVAIRKKNIWWMFVQMRMVMPLGMLVMIGFIIAACVTNQTLNYSHLLSLPQVIFFALGILGMIGMIVCSVKLDSADKKSNWIEQTINSLAQGFIFLGVLFLYLGR